MSRLDPPQVLIEASALAALADPIHHQHTAVAAAYRTLLARHRRNEVLLVAVSRHLRPLEVAPTDPWQTQLRWAVARPHRGLFAALDPLHVGQQHLNAAHLMSEGGIDRELALTLVMCERHRVRTVLTVDDRLAAYPLEVLPLGQPAED